MSKIKLTLLFPIFLLILVPAHSEGSDKEALTHQLMMMSGLEEQLNQISQHVYANLNEKKGSLPEDLYNALTSVMADAYDDDKMQEIVSERLSENLDIEDIRGVLHWLRSGLGRKITSLEEAASTPEAFKKMQAYSQQLQTNPPTTQRIELVQRLDNATNSTTMAVDIILFSSYGVATALDTTLPEGQQSSLDRIREQIESQRSQLYPLMQQMTMASFLYTFQTLSDVEIERYVYFCESEIGKKYHSAVGSAVMSALLKAAELMRADLIKALKDFPNRKNT